MIIGVTGPSGAGKSCVCKIAQEQFDLKVIDCDEYARKAVCPEMLHQLCARFGEDILNEDKSLNRRALAAKAFVTQEGISDLNKITHPYITGLVNRDIEKYKNVVLDAPTLYESGLAHKCDVVIAVLAQKEIRSKRILERDCLTEKQLDDRQKAAKADEFYTEKTDKIIINNGNIEKLKRDAEQLFCKILEVKE